MKRPSGRESAKDRRARAEEIFDRLQREYPDAHCALVHQDAYELTVATILSAQCTDARVNKVTPELFRRYTNPLEMAGARQEDVERLIHSTGFFRNKAKNLLGMATAVVEWHAGEIPRTLGELVKLPGVGRKTANVILGNAFGLDEGVVVDTHVKRLSRRLGLTRQTTPEKIEQALMRVVPRADWIEFSHLLIWHGRRRCRARQPDCANCELLAWCPQIGVPNERQSP